MPNVGLRTLYIFENKQIPSSLDIINDSSNFIFQNYHSHNPWQCCGQTDIVFNSQLLISQS